MMFDESDLARLAAEHQRYLDLMVPRIRLRLRARGYTIDHIERYISELSREHFRVAYNFAQKSIRKLRAPAERTHSAHGW